MGRFWRGERLGSRSRRSCPLWNIYDIKKGGPLSRGKELSRAAKQQTYSRIVFFVPHPKKKNTLVFQYIWKNRGVF